MLVQQRKRLSLESSGTNPAGHQPCLPPPASLAGGKQGWHGGEQGWQHPSAQVGAEAAWQIVKRAPGAGRKGRPCVHPGMAVQQELPRVRVFFTGKVCPPVSLPTHARGIFYELVLTSEPCPMHGGRFGV